MFRRYLYYRRRPPLLLWCHPFYWAYNYYKLLLKLLPELLTAIKYTNQNTHCRVLYFRQQLGIGHNQPTTLHVDSSREKMETK